MTHAPWTEYSKSGVVKLTAVVNGVYWIVPLPTGHGTQVRLRHQQASDDAEEYLQGFLSILYCLKTQLRTARARL